jgi:hypothetical protein
VTLAEASAAVPFAIMEPNSQLANGSNLQDIQICPPGDEVVLQYTNDVVIKEWPTTLQDPKATWEALAKAYDEFSVGTVRGVPAALAQPGVAGSLGGVHFVEKGVEFIVLGNGSIGVDELVGVAESLRPTPSAS